MTFLSATSLTDWTDQRIKTINGLKQSLFLPPHHTFILSCWKKISWYLCIWLSMAIMNTRRSEGGGEAVDRRSCSHNRANKQLHSNQCSYCDRQRLWWNWCFHCRGKTSLLTKVWWRERGDVAHLQSTLDLSSSARSSLQSRSRDGPSSPLCICHKVCRDAAWLSFPVLDIDLSN